jgi:hypothetical protein
MAAEEKSDDGHGRTGVGSGKSRLLQVVPVVGTAVQKTDQYWET